MISVAKEGNKRDGEASTEEIMQCITDIKSWFLEHIKSQSVSVANAGDFERFQKITDMNIPKVWKMLISEINGAIYIMDKQLLSVMIAGDLVCKLESSSHWNPSFLPLAGSPDPIDLSELIVIDTTNHESVWEWSENDGLGDLLAPSLAEYLEKYRDSLLNGHLEYLDSVGVLETVSKSQCRK